MPRLVARGVMLVALVALSACRSRPPVAEAAAARGSDAAGGASADESPGMPPGWEAPDAGAGAEPADYEVGLDRSVRHAGAGSAYIRRAQAAAPRGFMALTQAVRADAYQGRRVRLSGYVRTRDVADTAGLWMQVIGADGPAGFDNMENRPIRGTADWTRHAVVLDVAEDAVVIAFGFLLQGRGQAWVDDLRLEAVGPDVASTNIRPPRPAAAAPDSAQREGRRKRAATLPAEPRNLDFETARP